MYDELIKDLRESAPKALAEADFDFVEGWLKEAADAIEELIAALTASNEVIAKNKPRWIPVTERLPDDRRDVQITVFWHDAWRTMYGYYDGEFWHLYAPMHTEVADVEVIGWMEKPAPMPLPEPPKEW